MSNAKPFDEHTQDYESWFERNRFAYLSELAAVRQQLPAKGRRIEIGVGTGRFAAPLGIKFGIEPSYNMCLIAKRRGILAVRAIGEALPFNDAEFDAALIVTTICFLDDVAKALAETRRILNEGGCVVIGFIDKDSPLGRLYRQQMDRSPFYGVATFYSAAEVSRLLEQARFRDITFAQTLFQDLSQICAIEPVREGHGTGSFIVAKGFK